MKKTVLIVEDDAVVRDIIKSALEKEYNVLEAWGYSEAVALSDDSIDIALIDYMLPDSDGFKVLRALRDIKSELPVVIITAYNSEDIILKALRAGATDYMKKPLVLSCLRKKISEILEGRKGEGPPEDSAGREEFVLDGAALLIENNFPDDLTRDDLAQKMGMNKSKFSTLFNERFGRSVKSYINSVRVKEAVKLLRHNADLNIGDIAKAVGYRNVMHFERVFKEIFGKSPKEYRMNPPPEEQSFPNNLWSLE